MPRAGRSVAIDGFFLGWLGLPGRGRALGVGEVKFADQVLPTIKKVVYGVDIKRVFKGKLILGIADGWLEADGRRIYSVKDMRVGLFGPPNAGFALTDWSWDEARCRHRHGHRLVDRQQYPGSAGEPARGKSGITRAERLRRTRLSQPGSRRADLRRRKWSIAARCVFMAAAPPGTTSRWIRRSATAVSRRTRSPTSGPV